MNGGEGGHGACTYTHFLQLGFSSGGSFIAWEEMEQAVVSRRSMEGGLSAPCSFDNRYCVEQRDIE